MYGLIDIKYFINMFLGIHSSMFGVANSFKFIFLKKNFFYLVYSSENVKVQTQQKRDDFFKY